VLEGLRGEVSIAQLCRKEGIAQSMYYGWSKEMARRTRHAPHARKTLSPDPTPLLGAGLRAYLNARRLYH
jgi:transposase